MDKKIKPTQADIDQQDLKYDDNRRSHIGEVTCGEGSYKAARNDISEQVEDNMMNEALAAEEAEEI